MEIEPTLYINFSQAVALHLMLMQRLGETQLAVFDRGLIDSALSRPRNAAEHENADLISQSAALCLGVIKDRPWNCGNKRMATMLADRFLHMNGMKVIASTTQVIEMAVSIESDRWSIDNIEEWYREHTMSFKGR